jgi:hypothetical protein
MQAPPSTSSILTYKDTTSELNRLKSVMTAKRADWDTRTTIPGSRFFSPKHKLATAMSEVYGSLGELASAYGSASVDLKYHNLTKAEKALTSAKAEWQLTLEDETQLDNDKSDVKFSVFARIATREEDSKIVDFGPCRKASEAYFGIFCSRVSGFLHVSCRNLNAITLMALRKRSFI